MKKKNFDCELVEWPLICRDLYQHMWMGGPDATPDLWKQPFSAVRASGGYPGNVEIWRMNLKNNRAPLQCYFKLCASFRSHWWIQTGITVRKRQIWVKFDEFQSRVTLKFDVWPWTRQIWGIWKLRLAYSPETPNLGQNRWCFVPCDPEIWWMTLENNRASPLCCFKLCATFHSHQWIETGVTVRKRPIWVKFDEF